jgi:hypothetical protein
MPEPKIDFQEELDFQPIEFQETQSSNQLPEESFLNWLTKSNISREQILSNPVRRGILESIPSTEIGGVPIIPPFSQVIPPQIRGQITAENLSQRTSPLGVFSTGMELLGLAKGLNKLPQIMNKDFTSLRAAVGSDELAKLRTAYGQAKGKAIEDVADVLVNANEVPLNNLPKPVMAALEDPMYGIERNRNGIIRPTIANFDRIKEALGDFMTSKTWDEATKKSQTIIKQTYGKINEAMKNAAKDAGKPIDKALDNYHKFMEDYTKVIRTVENTSGSVVEKPLRSAFSPLSERTKIQAWERLAKQSPKIAQMVKDMKKFTGRRATQLALGGLGGLGLASYVAHRAITQPILDKLERR